LDSFGIELIDDGAVSQGGGRGVRIRHAEAEGGSPAEPAARRRGVA
jgi:hypothetical protein